MLTHLAIRGYRGLATLDVPALERVNLLVGKNNSGKSSVLEAVELLTAGGAPATLWRVASRRGEFLAGGDEARPGSAVEVRHLFHGRSLQPGTAFRLEGTDAPAGTVTCEVVPGVTFGSETLPLFPEEPDTLESLALRVAATAGSPPAVLPLNAQGALTPDAWRRTGSTTPTAFPPAPSRPQAFLGTIGADNAILSQWWDSVVLTAEEERVVDILRIIEPKIERIAFAGRESSRLRTAALVKLAGSDARVPLGSMGDGVRRLLAIALHLSRAAGGVLMIDEIDTGLHHSVLERLWAMVIEGARRLDVQVFATSHSGDCVRALAWLHESTPDVAASAALHRVEANFPVSVRYSAGELATAARHHTEVR